MIFLPLLLALSPAPQTGSDVLDAAALAFSRDRPREALDELLEFVREGAQRLSSLEGEAASTLADELELALVWRTWLGEGSGDGLLDSTAAEAAAAIQVDPGHGMLYARLARLAGKELEELAPLCDWEFVGPFDNERGQGMLTTLPPGEDPLGLTYPGKVRPVGWRRLPSGPPRSGIVRFSRLVDPSSQVCILARTWIRSAEARRVLLLLGAEEEVRLWLDGEPRLVVLGAHDLAPDTWCVPLELAEGWNELALEVGGGERAPAFTARLVLPQSAEPLRLEVQGERPEGAPAYPLHPAEAPPALTRPGVSRRCAGESDEGETLFRRALLEAVHCSEPRQERPGSATIQECRRRRGPLLRDDLLALRTLRRRGARVEEEDTSEWLATLDAMLQHYGPLPYLLRRRARHAWRAQPTYARALEYLGQALESAPGSLFARRDHALVLELAGQGALAQAQWRALARDEALSAYPGLALDVARHLPSVHPARASLCAPARAAGDPGAIALARRIEERARGSYGARDVLATLEEKLAHDPWSVNARKEAAGDLLTLNAPGEALEVLDAALAFAPDRAGLHRLRARALLLLGDVESAVNSLETVVDLDFASDDERRLLDHLEAQGGEPFQTPFVEELESILARRAGDLPLDAEVAPREVLSYQRVVEVQPNGTAKRYLHQVERILTETGARDLDRRAFRVWPGDEEVRVLRADVLHPGGELERGRTGRTGRHGTVVVDLPPLAVGDIVDLEWRHDDLRTTHFGDYFGFDAPFSPDQRLPVRESEIVLIVPEDFPLTLNARLPEGAEHSQEKREDGATVHRWVARDLSPRRVERFQPPPVEDAPRVQASSYASWQEFGRWWWNLIEDELEVSEPMAAKVAELCADAATPLDKLRAIYDFVVTDVRYNAWEFGVHGYQPYSAPVIFSRRFGDCKDKAILLRALLSEAGIEAWPVLLRMAPRRYEEDHTLALVGDFNHCIAYVPAQEGIPEMFLDGTARLHPLEVLPDADRGAKVLIVRADGARTARIPFPEPEANTLRDEIRVDLTAGEGAAVTLVRRPMGRWDPRHRQRFTGNATQRSEEVERFLTSMFGALLAPPSLDPVDFEDLTRPLELRFQAQVQEVARPAQGGYELPTTFDPLNLLVDLASEPERKTDLLLDVPWVRDTRIEYLLGEGRRVVDPPEPIELETEDAAYRRVVEPSEAGVVVSERFTLRTHRIPLERYPAFRELCRAVDAAQDAALRVEGVR